MFAVPGPICGYAKPGNLKDGTSCLVVSPRPGTVGRNHTVPAMPRAQGGLGFTGGTPIEEAKSLLRPCLPHGNYVPRPKSQSDYGKPLDKLPEFLNKHVGTAIEITLLQFRKYLDSIGVSETQLGGPLDSDLPKARYLVIHDTSYKLGNHIQTFPDSINTIAYVHNQIRVLKTKKDAHVFISRVGDSSTGHDFSQPFSATKYTNVGNSPPAKELKAKFCHVEMIQPRLGDHGSDWKAPDPGFTFEQLDRLALVYIAASFRHGEWLIPAYHHNVDMGFDAHDDPQNFDLEDWSKRIDNTVDLILRGPGPGDRLNNRDWKNAG
jgi:hypothetical protein